MIISKKRRDAKFIIYQSLYILVIVLLGIKGYTIGDIPEKKEKPDVDTTNISGLIDSMKVLQDLRMKYNFVTKWAPGDTNVTFDKANFKILRINEIPDLGEILRLRGEVSSLRGQVSSLNNTIASIRGQLKDCDRQLKDALGGVR